MTCIANGRVTCSKPARYVQQLVSHWKHKMDASWEPLANGGCATFPFSDDTFATMVCKQELISIQLTTPSVERNIEMRGVIERHIERFAFREAPLSYEWALEGV